MLYYAETTVNTKKKHCMAFVHYIIGFQVRRDRTSLLPRNSYICKKK